VEGLLDRGLNVVAYRAASEGEAPSTPLKQAPACCCSTLASLIGFLHGPRVRGADCMGVAKVEGCRPPRTRAEGCRLHWGRHVGYPLDGLRLQGPHTREVCVGRKLVRVVAETQISIFFRSAAALRNATRGPCCGALYLDVFMCSCVHAFMLFVCLRPRAQVKESLRNATLEARLAAHPSVAKAVGVRNEAVAMRAGAREERNEGGAWNAPRRRRRCGSWQTA